MTTTTEIEDLTINLKGAGLNGASLLLGALVGTGCGTVLGWYLSRRSVDKEISKEVEGVKQYYSDKARAEAASTDGSDSDGRGEAAMADPGQILASGRVITKIENPRVSIVLDPGHPLLEGFEEVGSGDDEEEDDLDDSPTEDPSDRTKPYVVSDAEFFEQREDYNKITVTYYAEDNTLCDERDAPIRDTSIVGEGFADLFGQDSNDEAIVHIRNDKIQVDFEIIRNQGSYVRDVLGYGKPP